MVPSRDELRILYSDSLESCYSLAKRFSVAPQTISKWLKKLGIVARKSGPLPGTRGHAHTLESREKLRKAHLGKKLSSGARERAINNLRVSWKRGSDSPFWRGGKYVNKNGYVVIRIGPRKFIKEHRQVMERYLGRKLLSTEHVHHINGNRMDNRVENLQLVNNFEHALLHWTSEENRLIQSQKMKELRSKRFWSSKTQALQSQQSQS